jgi:predicted PurR-regulated permease PerM
MTNHKIKEKFNSIFRVLRNADILHDKNSSKEDTIIILISAILKADDKNTDRDIEYAASCLSEELSLPNNTTLKNKLSKKYTIQEIVDAASKLSVLNKGEKEAILLNLIETSLTNGTQTSREKRIISIIAKEFTISKDELTALYTKALQRSQQKKKILNSAAGLLLALCIIVLFLLAATYLKSVVFGLILACFCLPVQEWINKHVIKSSLFVFLTKLIQYLFLPFTYPFKKIRTFFYHTKGKHIITKKSRDLKQVSLSSTATVFAVILFMLIVLGSISWVSTSCFSSLTNSVSGWVEKTAHDYDQKQITVNTESSIENTEAIKAINKDIPEHSVFKSFVDAMLYKIDSLKPTIENSRFFQIIKKWLNSTVQESETKGGLPGFLLKKTGGIFSFTTGAIGSIFSFLMNLVFTFFFFAFFLNQMAKLNYKINNKVSPGQHIVRGISSSGWFPSMKGDTVKGTVIIIDDILSRLKAWIHGYLSIIIIETIFYVTTFLLAGVPYAVGVGIFAGLTILLPYIGPVISFLLTASVCLVFGTGGMIQILIVLILYLIMNGICEQLFLYPAIVGGALGLNEFETIIVVLLGGILAGVTGLIFAVPVAAILKYLIPKAYTVINRQMHNNNT